ncbi:MAG: TlpA family protein disulfide reductase [Acidimicrobiales bacterium]
MTAAVIGLALCVALLGVLVAGLARRVARLQAALGSTPAPGRPPVQPRPRDALVGEPAPASGHPQVQSRPRDALVGEPAPDVSGVDPGGRPAVVEREAGQRLLMAFLTGGCEPCRGIWSPLAAGRRPGLPATVVTPSPTTESSRAVAALAGAGVPVVMSSEAWLAYGVRGAPWFVVVGDGTVLAEGRAESWEELVALVAPGP